MRGVRGVGCWPVMVVIDFKDWVWIVLRYVFFRGGK